jgi:hypothetical protein
VNEELMKIKKEYLILGVIIAALAVYLYQRSSDRALYTLPKLPALAASDITRIQVTRPGETVVLARTGGRWVIDPRGWPVDPQTVQEMLDTLTGLTLTALVAESKTYTLYELDDDRKVNVKAWQGDQLRRDIDIGKAAPSFRHTFVRIAGDDRVFHGQDNISIRFRAAVDDLRDKSVLAFNRQDIQEIQVVQAAASVSLTRAPAKADPAPAGPAAADSWQAADGQAANSVAVQGFLTELSSLRCEQFIDDRDKAGLGAPVYSIVLKGPQDYTLALFASGAKDAARYPAVSSGSGDPFLLSEHQAKRIMKNPADFFKAAEKKDS